MYIKFKKDHIAGLVKGQVSKIDPTHGGRLIGEGYAEESDEESYYDYVSNPNKQQSGPKEPTLEELAQAHKDKLNAMSLDALNDYINNEDLKITVEEGATAEDIVTLIELAEEDKKSNSKKE